MPKSDNSDSGDPFGPASQEEGAPFGAGGPLNFESPANLNFYFPITASGFFDVVIYGIGGNAVQVRVFFSPGDNWLSLLQEALDMAQDKFADTLGGGSNQQDREDEEYRESGLDRLYEQVTGNFDFDLVNVQFASKDKPLEIDWDAIQ